MFAFIIVASPLCHHSAIFYNVNKMNTMWTILNASSSTDGIGSTLHQSITYWYSLSPLKIPDNCESKNTRNYLLCSESQYSTGK